MDKWGAPLVLILAIPFYAVQVRRCNDAGLSKWYILGQFIPIIGFIWTIIIGIKSSKDPRSVKAPQPANDQSLRDVNLFGERRGHEYTYNNKKHKQANANQNKEPGLKEPLKSRIISCPDCNQRLKINLPIHHEVFRCRTCSSRLKIRIDTEGAIYITHVIVEKRKHEYKPKNEDGPTTTTDSFNILGLAENATKEEIKKAYKIKMKEYHPDRVESLGEKLKVLAGAEAKKINKAYSILQKKGYA